jgi:aryl-alcohol dehydrogenase-like predicted oxidoreductase
VTAISSSDFERGTDDRHSADLVQAHLFEVLTCVGRDCLDVYFLRVRRAAEEYQIAGALMALETARQEGHVRFLGIFCDGPPLATLGTWQFHDAFEVLLAPVGEALEMLEPLARERRVGVVCFSSRSLRDREVPGNAHDSTVMVPVHSAEDVRWAVGGSW